ncbi:MAG: xanthine dehydrogenase family protein subunit M [Chloroflexi bacterium]|nr:xanthine dehydrogenase family protein subunit M [Chloroflexota bacterium]MCH9018720.1 xanthine dehydrogenase family protein subunit M [Chloroflexota bacterium]MCI0801440.1 xanthine dehydrogenase family protein subunit M [Chloroflexota bacterium]MCI0829273.1 xanthine dehydrogenase family protein subunit M [Chloroflexota bacterium]MCI0847873.1 xanthine dehydrogenase family protein subunit M [Chloroflexota bacterium]
MEAFDFVSPISIEEAVKTLASHGDKARIMAGGTDMLVQMRAGRRTAPLVVDIKGIPELNVLSYDSAKGLTLGAAVPCYKIYQDKTVAAAYPGLIDAAYLIGGIQIQGRATIGGNICNAAPSGDAIPAVIALSGVCNIAGPNGTREMPCEEFCTAPGRNALENGEILVSISMPVPQANSGANYLRFIPRNEMDIAVAGVGVSVVLDGSGQNFVSARISLASVAPTPVFAKEAGDSLAGKPVSEEAVQQASELAQAASKPINDMRGTIRQRTHLIGVLTRRSLNKAIERARGG